MNKIQFTTLDTTTVSTSDRGLNYGDGFFTTAKIVDGAIEFWPLHCERLRQCQERLLFPELDLAHLHHQLLSLIDGCQLGVLKVVITRGVGGRGYSAPENPQPNAFISISPFPEHYAAWQHNGISLAHAQTRLGLQPLFAGLKTLNRLEQVMIKAEIGQTGTDDVLVSDLNNHVIETSVGNIIAVKGGRFYTPDLSQSGILGVYLQYIAQHHLIQIRCMTAQDIASMDAVFCCNSLMGLVPIKSIGNQCYDQTIATKWRTELNPSAN